jgi:hypothetical protein
MDPDIFWDKTAKIRFLVSKIYEEYTTVMVNDTFTLVTILVLILIGIITAIRICMSNEEIEDADPFEKEKED